MIQKFTNCFLRPLLLVLTMIVAADGFGQIYYVRPTGSDASLGTSWASPFQSIQRALLVATSGSIILVEKGTYYPDQGFGAVPLARTSSFVLKNGVSLYGGFDPNAGIDDLTDIRVEKSRLSGDLSNNGGSNLEDNAYHVVTSTGIGESTVFDGFYISGGNANGGGTDAWGGGMFNTGSALTISNCDFENNQATIGGGIANVNAPVTLNNCNLFYNFALIGGGGIYNSESLVKLNNCSVFFNASNTNGAGIYNTGSSPIITNTSIYGQTGNAGGGVSNRALSNPSFINCLIYDNVAIIGGGVENQNSNPVFINTTIRQNRGSNSGGAIHNSTSNPILTNCIVWDNFSSNVPEINDFISSTTTVTYSIVKGGFAGTGNLDLDPLLSENSLMLTVCSPAIDAGSNEAIPVGVLTDLSGNARISNSVVDMGALEYNLTSPVTYYRDSDGDTYGNPNDAKAFYCSTIPPGWVDNNGDCDDSKNWLRPGVEDVCYNGIDEDCNGIVDDNDDCGIIVICENNEIYYRDSDGDGYGDAGDIIVHTTCDIGYYPGYVSNGDDCNDDFATIKPGAAEICGNGIDDNCNGLVDENCDPCGVFSNLTTTNISSTSATLNWVASTNPDQWQVQYKSTSKGSKWIDVPNVAPADRSVTINNLTRNQSYIWHIRAKCGKVMTKYSSSVEFKTAMNSNTSAALAVSTQKDQVALASALVVYPSPASQQFTIRLNLNTGVASPVAIQLFDMNGKMVMNQNAGLVSGLLQKQLTLPSSLSNGLYLVRITADGKVFNRKLIVNK